ncbi:hypothetical protein G6F16_006096 [Rhizopus arrhizus]|nr:hypothetical protein G6F21_001622 [Rhizopus arrhizus]KAG0810487.1 hypothetical protein G6F20_007923 [Rhizopus arrhizus]KAG0833208.1 hypothetical protein G6F19_005829 [Rhizopus arrhizus]KAG0835479.1 hypothetical protein G6F18_005803 [Rhizopus arrhizus]KAG0852385.1 hypothetical protein G6F17_008153 [Rhizopus arrhizus]
MAYSRSPPRSPQEDWISKGLQSVKTYSTSSTRSRSIVSTTSSRAYSLAHYENTARLYYLELGSYLKDILDQELINGPHPQRVAARQKLTRLSNSQFHELAMDVYDEVVRRTKDDKYVPFLPVKEDFHPKRNQARQKLATLAIIRFKDLASDVYSELARRYINLNQDHEDYHLPPVPKMPSIDSKLFEKSQTKSPSKSTQIIPVKGTISVENLDKFSDDETILNSPDRININRSPEKEVLLFNNSNSSSSSRSIASTLNNDYTSNNDGIEKVRSEYEYQISIMKNRIKQLEDKLEMGGMNSIDRELLEQLQTKEREDEKIICQLEEQYKKLDDKYTRLKDDYEKQQDAVQEVKPFPTGDRYSKSIDLINENFLQPTRNGIINYDHILTYQASIDDLLSTARSSNPVNVIQVMKAIVTICKSITEQVETSESRLSNETKYTLYELKTRFSTALSDLLIAAKHHANGKGLSPVSLLDCSAGHLTAVVIDLTKLLGMKDTSLESDKSFYRASDDRPPISMLRSQLNDQDNSQIDDQGYPMPSELASYLKSETDTIVQTVQNLLSALRLPQPNDKVYTLISTLVKIVSTITELARSTCSYPSGYAYSSTCTPILNELSQCSQRLGVMQIKHFGPETTASASVKRDLAKEAYEIAKYTKELINLFETN